MVTVDFWVPKVFPTGSRSGVRYPGSRIKILTGEDELDMSRLFGEGAVIVVGTDATASMVAAETIIVLKIRGHRLF